MRKNIYILTSIILLLTACATRTVYKLHPVPPSSQWYMGRNILTQTVNNVTANIAFDIVERRYIVFLVEIVNHSDKTVLVDPAKFYFTQYHHLKSANDTLSGKLSNKFYAKNPEQAILETEKKIARENAQYAEDELADVAFGLLDFIGCIANLGKSKTREEMAEDQKEHEEERQREIEQDERHVRNINSLNKRLDAWKNTTLRITSLEPNHSICGKVFFPKCIEKMFLAFHFPVGGSNLQFVYKRTTYEP